MASAAVLVAGATSSAASAQQVASNTVETVVVTGSYQESLTAARNIKRESVILKDAIVAEDMAKFPELNLAESLQRLPGVQITREAGEGRRISLRGLGPDFARVQLNGMEVLGNVDSAQDSRGQRSRDRSFDFNIFASELFSKVEVEKTFQASQNEGGMAGTVGLFTGKPLDYNTGFKGAVTAKAGSNQYTGDLQPRIAALASYNWDDKFGIAVSVAYGHRRTTEEGHNTYNYSLLGATTTDAKTGKQTGKALDLVASGVDISHLSADKQQRFLAGNLYFPDGNRISSWNGKQDRLGLTAAVQWKPTNNILLTLDALHGEFTVHRDELHLATRPLNGLGSTNLDGPKGSPWPAIFQNATVFNNYTVDANGYVTMTDSSNVTFGSEHRREKNLNVFNQGVLTGTWDVSDALTIDGHIGAEKSLYKTPYDDKLYMRAKGGLIANYGTDGRSASFQYTNWDPTNPANYAMDNFYYRAFNNSSELKEGVLNARYKLDEHVTLRAGVAYHNFSQNGASYYYDGGDNGTTAITRGTSVADITTVFHNSYGSWLIGDYDKAFAKYKEYHRLAPKADGTGGALKDIENVFKVDEKTVSYYAQVDWDSEMFGKPFRGNIGVRGYSTDTRSQGWIQGKNYAYLGTADVKGSYDGLLPALNTVLELTPEVLVRFTATQNLNRPSLGSIAAQGSAFQNNTSTCDPTAPNSKSNCDFTASRGNPNLKPFLDTTLDLGVEYYFGKVGLISVGVFQKYVKNFITSKTWSIDNGNALTYAQAQISPATTPGATADTLLESFSMPINDPGTKKITGVELAAQSQFDFLPAPFNNLGAVVNYTYVDFPQSITGISNTSYNATLYYETSDWGARASLSHRSSWFTGHGATPMSADTRGFTGGNYVDAALFYNITDQLQATLDAVNLTNQKDTQFWGQNRYLYNQTQSGTTYMGGISYKF
ncbi:TonB-dependent receptor [Rhizomicrobium palustre]|uniref:TonB-dependent receptor n=2 Tax=Rhizomicrobium palustre TaxID=189966 RepID=A0A846N2Q6_9PROT|nr:TonB-dependent receptor [Rhizomicrobium palustre]NIK89799.1 TonB-dependent receptor [Rhizomicrobium palustre]